MLADPVGEDRRLAVNDRAQVIAPTIMAPGPYRVPKCRFDPPLDANRRGTKSTTGE